MTRLRSGAGMPMERCCRVLSEGTRERVAEAEREDRVDGANSEQRRPA